MKAIWLMMKEKNKLKFWDPERADFQHELPVEVVEKVNEHPYHGIVSHVRIREDEVVFYFPLRLFKGK